MTSDQKNNLVVGDVTDTLHQVALPPGHLPPLPPGIRSSGKNLGSSPILDARSDREAILAWLARDTKPGTTRMSYLKEADRLYRWAAIARGKTLSDLTHEDMELYRRFLQNPQPASHWVSKRKFPREHPEWKPFSGPLCQSSITLAMNIINSMMIWLVNANYLKANPLALSRKRRNKKLQADRYLTQAQVSACFRCVGTLPRETSVQTAHYHRCRWMIHLFLLAGVRISEAANNTFGSYRVLPSPEGSKPWLVIMGKGDKERKIPMNSELSSEMHVFINSLGLAENRSGLAGIPLVPRVRGAMGAHMSRQALHLVMKEIFARAITLLESEDQYDEAQGLRSTSAHWLRHTTGTLLCNAGVDIRAVQRFLGHESLSTTTIYTHIEDHSMHKEISQKFHLDLLLPPPPSQREEVDINYWKARAQRLEDLLRAQMDGTDLD